MIIMAEKFSVGDKVSFNIEGTEIKGEGEILCQSTTGLMPFWVISLEKKDTKFLKKRPEKAIVVQESFIKLKKCHGIIDNILITAKQDSEIKQEIREWMEQYWGKRCPDHNKNCCLCKAWDAFDVIFNGVE